MASGHVGRLARNDRQPAVDHDQPVEELVQRAHLRRRGRASGSRSRAWPSSAAPCAGRACACARRARSCAGRGPPPAAGSPPGARPAGWAVSSSVSASSTADSRNRLMFGRPRISSTGLPGRRTTERLRASEPKVSAHAADSESSSATCRPIGATTPDCAAAGSAATQPPDSAWRSRPRSISTRTRRRGRRGPARAGGRPRGARPIATTSRKIVPAGPSSSARRCGPCCMFMQRSMP